MTSREAMLAVNNLAFVVQRMRSMAAEEIGSGPTERAVLQDVQPWVHGPKSLVPALAAIQDRGRVTPLELYNFCYVAHRLEPSIAVSADIMSDAGGGATPIPQPSLAWLSEGFR